MAASPRTSLCPHRNLPSHKMTPVGDRLCVGSLLRFLFGSSPFLPTALPIHRGPPSTDKGNSEIPLPPWRFSASKHIGEGNFLNSHFSLSQITDSGIAVLQRSYFHQPLGRSHWQSQDFGLLWGDCVFLEFPPPQRISL